ncbi:MATE family efflux transporter, partial [Bdellovibrionota bacterium FG-2]
AEYFAQAVRLCLALTLPISLILFGISFYLPKLDLDPAMLQEAQGYFAVLSWSLVPGMLFTIARQYLQAQGVVAPAVWILVFTNILNVALNYTLVFGNWGFPRLSAAGSGWATLISRIVMMAAMGAVVYFHDSENGQHLRVALRKGWNFVQAKAILKLGGPAAFHFAVEVGAFSAATQLAARLGTIPLAAHQIALNVVSITFMIPLGVGSAASVLVGAAKGQKNLALVIRRGREALILGLGFMFFSALVLWFFPAMIVRFYSVDEQVIATGVGVLALAALFQLSDGAQVVFSGALRGLADTKTAAIANFCGHWLVGLPLGVYLCFEAGLGLRGLWIGLSVGLTLVAVVVGVKWFRSVKISIII